MAPPFIPWPGADGLLTTSMWAWRFPNTPPFLGPVPLRDPRYLVVPPPCPEKEEYFGLYGVRPRQVPLLGQDFSKPPTPPPCSTGYIPVIDQGVLKCIPGSSGTLPNGLMTPPQRTFHVSPGYGWTDSEDDF